MQYSKIADVLLKSYRRRDVPLDQSKRTKDDILSNEAVSALKQLLRDPGVNGGHIANEREWCIEFYQHWKYIERLLFAMKKNNQRTSTPCNLHLYASHFLIRNKKNTDILYIYIYIYPRAGSCQVITASVCNTGGHENGYNKDFCLFHVFPKEKFQIRFLLSKYNALLHARARIEHTHEIVLSARSTTGIVFGTSFVRIVDDDVEEKKKPQECGSTTNNSQTGKE